MALSDILENLTQPAPSFLDPEDDFGDNTSAQLAANEKDEVEIFSSSKLRRRTASLLADTDVKYAGQKTSRKQIFAGDSENIENGDASDDEDDDKEDAVEESDSEDDMDIESFNQNIKEKFQSESTQDLGSDGFSDDDDAIGDDDDAEEEEDDDDDEEEGEDDDGGSDEEDEDNEEERDEILEEGKREDKDIQSFSKLGIESEMAKGKAVQSQLGMLDSLLEARIKIQRAVASMNQIPQPDTWNDFLREGGNKFSSAVNRIQGSVCNLLNSLVELQTTVLMKNPQTRHIITGDKAKEEDSDDEMFSDLEDDFGNSEEENEKLNTELKRKLTADQFPMFLAKRARKFESYRNSTIQKWDDKTKLSSGKISSKSFNALDQSAMKQVKQILYDKERLIKRTQLQRSVYKVFGKTEGDEKQNPEEMLKQISSQDHLKNRNPEIFDDSDFYHMLLQDYIRRKSSDSGDSSATTKQWMEIQQLRSKMKRKIDTRASKGRKIRYEVHKKLVNFMGPHDNTKWTQEMRDELYRSLFGQQCKSADK